MGQRQRLVVEKTGEVEDRPGGGRKERQGSVAEGQEVTRQQPVGGPLPPNRPSLPA